jgi:hypothetical protein
MALLPKASDGYARQRKKQVLFFFMGLLMVKWQKIEL